MIRVIAVGKVDIRFEALEQEYLTRLKSWYPVELVRTKAEPFADVHDASRALAREAQGIEKALKPSERVIRLSEHGKQYDSLGFAHAVGAIVDAGEHTAFIIGGALGFDADFACAHPEAWSLSALTFIHGAVPFILLEQLYRATTILKGKQYHY